MYTRLPTHSTKLDLSDPIQQNKLYLSEESALSFTDDTDTHCDYNISAHNSDIPNIDETYKSFAPKHPPAHSQRKHAYRDTFGDAHIQYHEFDNKDLLTVRDKYTALHKNYKIHIGIYMTQS